MACSTANSSLFVGPSSILTRRKAASASRELSPVQLLHRREALAEIVKVRSDVRPDLHVRPNSLVAEERLVVERLATGGPEMDPGLDCTGHENILAQASRRVGSSGSLEP